MVDTEKSAGAANERQNVRRIVDLLEAIDHVPAYADAYAATLRSVADKPPGHGIDLGPDPEVEARVAAFRAAAAAQLRQPAAG